MNKRVLGLDCSSVMIGYALLLTDARYPSQGGLPYHETVVKARGHIELEGEIDQRIESARRETANLIRVYEPTIVIVESPASVYAGGLIPQARVSGGVLLAVREAGLLWAEVTPSQAKKALYGTGRAGKPEMLRAAADRIGMTYKDIVKYRGKWWAIDGNDKLLCEDEADALGVALAGLQVPICNS
jgi:Holliday junction resolvasome RuvABC endonuclease subunit